MNSALPALGGWLPGQEAPIFDPGRWSWPPGASGSPPASCRIRRRGGGRGPGRPADRRGRPELAPPQHPVPAVPGVAGGSVLRRGPRAALPLRGRRHGQRDRHRRAGGRDGRGGLPGLLRRGGPGLRPGRGGPGRDRPAPPRSQPALGQQPHPLAPGARPGARRRRPVRRPGRQEGLGVGLHEADAGHRALRRRRPAAEPRRVHPPRAHGLRQDLAARDGHPLPRAGPQAHPRPAGRRGVHHPRRGPPGGGAAGGRGLHRRVRLRRPHRQPPPRLALPGHRHPARPHRGRARLRPPHPPRRGGRHRHPRPWPPPSPWAPPSCSPAR